MHDQSGLGCRPMLHLPRQPGRGHPKAPPGPGPECVRLSNCEQDTDNHCCYMLAFDSDCEDAGTPLSQPIIVQFVDTNSASESASSTGAPNPTSGAGDKPSSGERLFVDGGKIAMGVALATTFLAGL